MMWRRIYLINRIKEGVLCRPSLREKKPGSEYFLHNIKWAFQIKSTGELLVTSLGLFKPLAYNPPPPNSHTHRSAVRV